MTDYTKMWEEIGVNVPLHEELLQSIGRTFKLTVGAQKNRPESMKYFDEMLHESHGGRVKQLVDNMKAGNKNMGTFCIYVPEELPMAVDVIPIPLCGGVNFSIPYSEQTFPRDICPLVKSTLGLSSSGTCPYKGVKQLTVGETTCDAKKKVWDVLSAKMPFHVMEVPQKKNEFDVRIWRQEVDEFRSKVEDFSGKKVEAGRLAKSIKIMNDKRRALLKLSELRRQDPPPISGQDALLVMQMALNADHEEFTEKLGILNAELAFRIEKNLSPIKAGSKRIMVSGCPSVMGNWKVHALIEQAGGVVVVDETCTGTRYFENLVETTSTNVIDMTQALADRYFKIKCSCFTPNTERIADVQKKIEEYKVDGVVQYILQYCHTYNIEAMRVEGALKTKGIPSLKIVTDYSEEDTGQLRTRIEAFMETLQ
jgi:benzoyl-CoA reductase/2-hydroxyglutaryl-CoA dehydratase subunit BcrC/BadD/HgdB